jgi:hypothetical protein
MFKPANIIGDVGLVVNDAEVAQQGAGRRRPQTAGFRLQTKSKSKSRIDSYGSGEGSSRAEAQWRGGGRDKGFRL